MIMAETILTQARLKELLDYDPETGVFTWKRFMGGFAKAGSVAGSIDSHGHRQIKVDGRLYLAHRMVFVYLFAAAPSEVDHINRDKLDNRLANLRPVTRSENLHNSPPNRRNRVGVKGVHWIARLNKWQAYISAGGRRKILGCFATFDAAVAARREAEKALVPVVYA
jgi:hypothetical protein